MYTKTSLLLLCMLLLIPTAHAQSRRGGGGGRGGMGGVSMPSLSSLQQQWEYGRLEIHAQPATKDGPILIWRGPANEKIEGKTIADLYQKLGGSSTSTDPEDDLVIWNLLGEKGWDFMERQTLDAADTPAAKTRTTVISFKRTKR